MSWPTADEFPTAVGLDPYDDIAVAVLRMNVNTDRVNNGELQTSNDEGVARELGGDYTFDSPIGDRLMIDNARALHYRAKYKKTASTVDFYFVFRGTAELEITCDLTHYRPQIAAGCRQVLTTLQFKTVK